MAGLHCCLDCHRLTEGTRCPEHEQAKRGRIHRRGSRFYKEPQWKRFSKSFRAEHPRCANPDGNSDCTLVSQETDHVVPVPDGCTREQFYAGPFQALCRSCHSAKTARENAFGG